MIKRDLLVSISSFALLGCSTAVAQPNQAHSYPLVTASPERRDTDFSERLLEAHNRERAQVGVAPLIWDAKLAADAASYGPTLATIGQLQHSPRGQRPGQSENLWFGTRGAYSPEQMVGNWAQEKAYFRPGIFPNVSNTGNWLDVAHYTLMIWRTVTHLGCAVHQTTTRDYLICRYSPRGNRDGQPVP